MTISRATTKLQEVTAAIIRRFSERPLVFSGLAFVALLVLLLCASLWPRQVSFSYSESTCFTDPVLLPELHTSEDSESFRVTQNPTFSIGSYPIFSSSTCVEALSPPNSETETVKFKPLHLPLIYQAIKITAQDPPSLSTPIAELERISITEPLLLELESPDMVFSYSLSIDENGPSDCTAEEQEISCPVDELGLEQAELYDLTVDRHINGHIDEPLLTTSIETVTPITVTEASIDSGATIHSEPEDIIITADKPIDQYDGVELMRTDTEEAYEILVEVEIDEDKLIIVLQDSLPREASFTLSIESLIATDKGFLSSPYELSFETSGGPQVESISIGSSAVPRSAHPTLRFDYPLSEEQDLYQHITIETGSSALPATIYLDGSSITLVPHQTLPRCTALSVNVSDELQNRHGISGGTAYTFNFRTLCQSVSTIGTSVQGRPIHAYSFGTGSRTVLYVGGIHGSEPSSKYILDSWINELEAGYDRIPDNRTIIVVPNLNPDGIVANSRTNSNGVDLNRNFPTNNWQSDVSMPDGEVEGGGGDEPLSEPESQAIASLITSQNPRHVLSYHAVGPFVLANDAGSSRSLASTYAQMVSYANYSGSGAGSIFSYDITGAMEDWLRESSGTPTVLIELSSYANNEFWRHREAMWSMTKQ